MRPCVPLLFLSRITYCHDAAKLTKIPIKPKSAIRAIWVRNTKSRIFHAGTDEATGIKTDDRTYGHVVRNFHRTGLQGCFHGCNGSRKGIFLLLPRWPSTCIPESCDGGYPCTICETDCKALCFSNGNPGQRAPSRHRLRRVTDGQMHKTAAAIHPY